MTDYVAECFSANPVGGELHGVGERAGVTVGVEVECGFGAAASAPFDEGFEVGELRLWGERGVLIEAEDAEEGRTSRRTPGAEPAMDSNSA